MPTATLRTGSASEVLQTLGSQSVQTVVTSPPYFRQRKYLDTADPSQELGRETTVSQYVDNLVEVFLETKRVLRDDGVLWLNLGDTYDSKRNLLGLPWRVALALQDSSWVLRNDIIWQKPNPIPFSGTNRFASTHEHLFMFTKGPKYYFNLDAVRVPHVSDPNKKRAGKSAFRGPESVRKRGPNSGRYHSEGKNPGDVWNVAVKPFPGAHFATFPIEIPRRCIMCSSRIEDTVLDPFSGSATTGQAALQLGRNYVGIDLDPRNIDLALSTRLSDFSDCFPLSHK